MLSLSGRTVLVTGVSSGLGAGIMRVFTRYGATVIGCARRADRGEELARSLREAGLAAHFVRADVTDEADRHRLVAACLDGTGRLDILINNAGALGEIAPIEATDPERWDDVLETNLTAAYGLCRLAIPAMKRQGDGVILNISSLNAVVGITQMAAYCSAKAGLAHLTRVIAAEGYEHGIRANAVILGGVRSEMTETLTRTLLTRREGSAPDERVAAAQAFRLDPDEVAASLAVLCLPEARLISGSEIAIDQAMLAGRALSSLLHGASSGVR